MNARIWQMRTLLLLAFTLSITQFAPAQPTPDASKRGLIKNNAGAYPGLTLYTPLGNNDTHLLNMSGEVVHTWKSDHPPANSVSFLRTVTCYVAPK